MVVNCSVVVIIKRETAAVKTAMLIQNDAEVPVTVRQAGLEIFLKKFTLLILDMKCYYLCITTQTLS